MKGKKNKIPIGCNLQLDNQLKCQDYREGGVHVFFFPKWMIMFLNYEYVHLH